MARAGIKGYNILLKGTMETQEDDTDEMNGKRVTATLNILNKMEHNKIILFQDGTICFRIVKEAKAEKIPSGDASKSWDKLSRNFQPTEGFQRQEFKRKFQRASSKTSQETPKTGSQSCD